MLDRRKRSKDIEEEIAPWMLTYGDMVTLLLVFFVFLSVYATYDVQKFREIVMSLKGTLGVLPSGIGPFDPGDLPQSGPDTGEPEPSQTLTQAVPETFEKKDKKDIEELGDDTEEGGGGDKEKEDAKGGGKKKEEESNEIYTYFTERGRVVMIPNVAEFGKTHYKITDDFKKFMRKLEPLFKSYSTQEILIIGHADKDSYRFSRVYPRNNWELASARAIAVVKFLTEELNIPQDRFAIQSCGEYKRGQRLVDIIFRDKLEDKRSVGFE